MQSDKLTVFAIAMLAFWVAALVTGAGTPDGWITRADGRPVQGDFVGVYTAGQLTRSDGGAAPYDWERHKVAHRELTGDAEARFFPWPYPPTFLAVAVLLSLLPFYGAMLTWTLATFAAFAAAIHAIAASRRHLLLLLATPAPWLNMYVGQNGALSAALIGFGLVMLPARPLLAGAVLGLLSFKPHLGLLLPIALAAGGYWRAFAAAAATVVALVLASLVVLGGEPWLAFPHQLAAVGALVKATPATAKIQSVYGFSRALGLDAESAMALQAVTVAGLIAFIAWLWRRRDVAYDLKAATLATAVTLASPYQFVYDLVILTIAQAFLMRHIARQPSERGFDLLEFTALFAANLLVFLFAATAVPLGIVASALVLMLIARRIIRAHPAALVASRAPLDAPAARAL